MSTDPQGTPEARAYGHDETDDWETIVDALRALLALADQQAATLAAVRSLHQPAEYVGMGYLPGGGYGDIEKVCDSCGTADEYGEPWPCPTIRAVDVVIPHEGDPDEGGRYGR